MKDSALRAVFGGKLLHFRRVSTKESYQKRWVLRIHQNPQKRLTLTFTKQALRNCFAKGNRQDLRVVCRLPSRAVRMPAIPEVAMYRTRRRPYPSDLSDAEWFLLEPLLASPERRGRRPKWP